MVDVAMTSPERAIEELLKVRTGFKREAGQQGKVILTGPYSLDATYNGVRLAEDFDLQLVVPGDYPASLPTVRETSGVIDPGYEHLYLNGTFCLGVRGELLLAQLENPSLVALLDGPIRSYLYSYLFRKRYGNYPFGDRAHGVRGILRYYEELFGEADFPTIMKLLGAVCFENYRGHLPCPCGSGLIARKCHGETILKLKKSGATEAFSSDFTTIACELTYLQQSVVKREQALRQTLISLPGKYRASNID